VISGTIKVIGAKHRLLYTKNELKQLVANDSNLIEPKHLIVKQAKE